MTTSGAAIPTTTRKAPGSRLRALWSLPRPAIMGIVNCTADSFSDGGLFLDSDVALAHAERLIGEGADIIDIGGESTRPGAVAISAAEEASRVIPVVSNLRDIAPDLVISVDTSKPEVAKQALAAGADIINDVTAASSPYMLPTIASAGAGVVLMHMRGNPRTMQLDTDYGDVIAEVHEHLRTRARVAIDAGIEPELVWLDPGIGFGKDAAGNISLLAALPALAALGHPVVIGPSRKSFIGRLTGSPIEQRLPGTLAALIPTVGLERAVARVHEVAPAIQFYEIATRVATAGR